MFRRLYTRMAHRFAILSLGFLAVIALPLPLAATPIDYIFSGVASGGLGTESFQSTGFVLTVSADTDLSFPWGDPSSTYFGWQTFAPSNSATIELAGVANTTIANQLLVWANPNCDCLGVSARPIANFLDFLVLENLGFDLDNPYDLTTSIGPVSASPTHTGSSGALLHTPLGDLRFDFANQTAFQATLVPLPSVSWLVVSAFGLLAPYARRRGTTA